MSSENILCSEEEWSHNPYIINEYMPFKPTVRIKINCQVGENHGECATIVSRTRIPNVVAYIVDGEDSLKYASTNYLEILP